jgi:hypothetical protein
MEERVRKAMEDQEVCSPEKLPKAPKQGYQTSPAFNKFKEMKYGELKKVENFKIYNEFGSVEYYEPTDVTQVDFADIVTIKKG